MSRYIEIDTALLKTVTAGKMSAKALWRRIMQQPTIDIVRCKECRYNYGNEHNCEYNPEDIVCTYWESDGLDADDYCSYGEREGE